MKKLAFLLAALLLLSACAPTAAPDMTTEAPATEATVQTAPPTEAPTETEAPESESEAPSVLDLALTFVDKSVDELKGALGEPDDAYYEDSCSGDGDDGFLYYGDIIVFTYREADGSAETVIDAELKD